MFRTVKYLWFDLFFAVLSKQDHLKAQSLIFILSYESLVHSLHSLFVPQTVRGTFK